MYKSHKRANRNKQVVFLTLWSTKRLSVTRTCGNKF